MDRTTGVVPSRFRALGALRHPQFRRFWLGMVASVTGFQMFLVAQAWLVYDLTGSPLYLGLLGLVSAVPAIVLTLFGGVVADRVDPRRLLVLTQLLSALGMVALGLLTALGLVEVWHALVVSFFTGALGAFDSPTRMALYPHLVDRRELMNAVALNAAVWQGTRVVAPAVAGQVIARLDTSACFFLAALGFLAMAALVGWLHLPGLRRQPGQGVWVEMVEGLRFIGQRPAFSFLMGMSFFNSVFGMSYMFLLPVFARDILEVGPQGLGYLYGAGGLGALLGTMAAATLGRVRSLGRLLIAGATTFGVALVLFGLSPWYYASLGLLFVGGLCNALYMTSVMTLLQAQVPDALRGRVMGVYGMTYNLLPLGGMQAGVLADLLGAPIAIVIGGVAVAAFALGVAGTKGPLRGLRAPVLQ